MSEIATDIMVKAAKDLSDVQKDFLAEEFGIAPETVKDITEERWDEIYDSLCDMEVDEISAAKDGDLTERGETICGLVTLFGNAIAESQDTFDEDDEDEQEA